MDEVRQSLLAEKWNETIQLATSALAERKWEQKDEAFLHYARSHSMNHLSRHSEALESGQSAVRLAEISEEWDLLGLSLLNLAFAQAKMPGGAVMAVSTTRRYFDHLDQYEDQAAAKYLTAMRNLGFFLHAAGDDEAALEQYLSARHAAIRRRNPDEADDCRRCAVSVALSLKRLESATDLIRQGEQYIAAHKDDPEITANHYIDVAALHELKREYAKALGKANDAFALAEGSPSLQAQALQIMHRVAKAQNKPKAALALGAATKHFADQAQRYEIIGPLSVSLKQIGLVNRDAVREFVDEVTRSGLANN